MLETIGQICSSIMTLWLIVGFVRDLTDNKYLIHFINETLYIIPIIVIVWFLFSGDASNIWDIIRLFMWGWIWYDAFKNRDDRWKKRKRRLNEKVKVLSSGKLAVVGT